MRIGREDFGDDRPDRFCRNRRCAKMERANGTLAFHKRHNRFFRRRFAIGAVASLPADIGFVDFNEFPFTAEHGWDLPLAHCLADAVRHEPGRFQRNAENAMQLIAAHSLLAGAEQMRCLKPLMQWYMALFEYGPDL